jgi:hypothetical protein
VIWRWAFPGSSGRLCAAATHAVYAYHHDVMLVFVKT